MRYRGKGAGAHREARRCADGRLRLRVPDRSLSIDVVEHYQHLGTFASLDGGCFSNVVHRCSSAMAVYGPLTTKVFGSTLVPHPHKFCFMQSLVLSRLLFGVFLTVPRPKELQRLNAVYMRVLRRIAGESRFSSDVQFTDREVRSRLGRPSLDCLIARGRLLFRGADRPSAIAGSSCSPARARQWRSNAVGAAAAQGCGASSLSRFTS